jgi:hypothetical protein
LEEGVQRLVGGNIGRGTRPRLAKVPVLQDHDLHERIVPRKPAIVQVGGYGLLDLSEHRRSHRLTLDPR